MTYNRDHSSPAADGLHLITERAEALREEIWWDETFTIGATTFHERIRPDETSGRAIARHVLDAAGFAKMYDALKALIPANIDLTNCNMPDSAVLPCDVTLGELRAAAAAIALAEGRS